MPDESTSNADFAIKSTWIELDREKLLKFLADYFKDKPVQKAYLFGSFARNEADKQSDVDILADLDYKNGIASEYSKMVIELKQILKRKIHLVTLNSVSPFIIENINKEKILIYER